MSYTTNRQPQGRPLCYTNLIREAMIGELVAINDYTLHIEEVRILLHHIMEDEKRHYGMLLNCLRKIDEVQYEKSKEAIEHVNLKNKYYKISSSFDSKIEGNVLIKLNEDIKGELEAIILYEQHLLEIPNEEVKEVFKELIDDEKDCLSSSKKCHKNS
ncbi:hypothetical protein CPJCM30710_12440 [Clostridium polyendosporum]|uniref:Rubrerythrin n=1 Tax=Clostridium polyendosporum TaxID=69208 RepID=A0A919VLG6_9CLOT|nr:hypothetical protein [Clostridium polyendosporum]GIM28578.1 hypothetical protein CPJCM30710_12440 [Clostridium polyendosporum]